MENLKIKSSYTLRHLSTNGERGFYVGLRKLGRAKIIAGTDWDMIERSLVRQEEFIHASEKS